MASQAVLHFVLTVGWIVLTGNFSYQNIVMGFLVGWAILSFYAFRRRGRLYIWRIVASVKLLLVLLWEQVKSSIEVASLVLSPKCRITPAIIGLPLRVSTDAEITVVANLLTLTPGGVSIHVSEDRSTLYMHVINVKGPGVPPPSLVATKERFEKLIMEVTRP